MSLLYDHREQVSEIQTSAPDRHVYDGNTEFDPSFHWIRPLLDAAGETQVLKRTFTQ